MLFYHQDDAFYLQVRCLPSSPACVLVTVKRNYNDDFHYLQRSIVPTNHFQKSLPRLPIPKLENSCQRYLNAQQPILTEAELGATAKIVEQFKTGEGKGIVVLKLLLYCTKLYCLWYMISLFNLIKIVSNLIENKQFSFIFHTICLLCVFYLIPALFVFCRSPWSTCCNGCNEQANQLHIKWDIYLRLFWFQSAPCSFDFVSSPHSKSISLSLMLINYAKSEVSRINANLLLWIDIMMDS